MATPSEQLQAGCNDNPESNSESSPTFSNINPSASNAKNAPASSNSIHLDSLTTLTPSIFRRAWAKLGINPLVATIMVKGALAPVIATAIYQSKSVAVNYQNLGYLMIVVSILTSPILPRGKFMMNLFISVVLTCFGAAMVLLGQWAGIKARQHTTPPGASLEVALGYNSSASVVNALFLMLNVFGINVLRAARPSLSIPSVGYTVFILVGFVYGPQEPTESDSLRFTKELLLSFLTGQAIATGVALFVIPVSSRKIFFAEAAAFLQTSRSLLQAQLAFVEVLGHLGMSEPSIPKDRSVLEDETGMDHLHGNASETAEKRLSYNQRASALKASTSGLLGLGGRLRDDVVFAKREIAYGHFGSKQIRELHRLLRNIMIAMSGLSTIADISDRLNNRSCTDWARGEKSEWSELVPDELSAKDRESENGEWQELIRLLHASFEAVIQALDEGILHVLILLNFVPDPKKASGKTTAKAKGAKAQGSGLGQDVEKGIGEPRPGIVGFCDYLDKEIQDFRKQRSERLRTWAEERGLSSVLYASAKYTRWSSKPNQGAYKTLATAREKRFSQRLHVVLYMEYLLFSVSKAILAIVRFAESNVEDSTIKKKRFIFPPVKTLIKWIKGLINGEDSGPDIDKVDNMAGNVGTIYLGDSLKAPKDPEHLPPKNFGQVVGNHIRIVPKFLGSDAVKFGVRVTIATMSIGILAYLHNTHAFFIAQRVVWAMVMIAIGMSPTSGSAVFNLLGTLTTTLVAMVGAIINWYIVDQKTAGVIVFLFLFFMLYFYFAAKNPRFLVPIVAGSITHVLIIGYELQVRVIGLKQATATGQEYYPLYKLAPYRLLAVAAGVVVAYIFTIFPVPIMGRSVLRRDLGSSLFLLANYVSSVTSTVDHRILDKEGNMSLSSSPGRKLKKMRLKVLQKQLALLKSMGQNLAFTTWEPSFGGDFPKATYSSIINEVQSVVNYLTVIAHVSKAFTAARSDPSSSTWLSEFARSRPESDRKLHKITSLLALLSASIRNNQALPPYLRTPEPFHLSDQIQGSDADILGLKNMNEPGFLAFAVIELAHTCLVDSVDRIVGLIRDLVGEVDFSYQIVDTSPFEGPTGEDANQFDI